MCGSPNRWARSPASTAKTARFRVRAQLESSRRQVNAGLNRSLAPNLTVRGSVDRLEPATIVALPDRLSIAVIATGTASIDVR